ncbi:MAG TPA: DUF362 domain-containing protein [bacterium]|nr:DUF362 domain-containing protein [bacterium]
MNRREFLKKSAKYAVAAAGAFSLSGAESLLGSERGVDLAAVKGGTPGKMFDAGINALGGIKNFVKPNQTVVVKPNIGWDVIPEYAANTNPELVAVIVRRCIQAGAKRVYVFDHTCDNWIRVYKNSGIEHAAKTAGAVVAPGNNESYYHETAVPGGKSLKKTKIHELIFESDVFINVPVLKHHGTTRVTIGMKNLMGNIWDRRSWHVTDLHQRIADFTPVRKPDLTVVDCYRVMTANGPRGVAGGRDVVKMESQVLSRDIVAADSAAARIFGADPMDIAHIKNAAERKMGESDLSKLNIRRITL